MKSEVKSSVVCTRSHSVANENLTCAGITKKGVPCKRVVKKDPPALVYKLDFATAKKDPHSDKDEDVDDTATKIERLCWQHRRKIMAAPGFYGRTPVDGAKQFIEFDGRVTSHSNCMPS